jgi:hypothetical protein
MMAGASNSSLPLSVIWSHLVEIFQKNPKEISKSLLSQH